ncbi:MAG: hypothetical protein M3092_00655, partial [Actinomycetia bacterium]|nr:hypothetical protein [Actinomycetes bacterium]
MRRYFVIAIVVGLVMTAGIAVAQVGDDEVIQACADTKGGDLRLVDTAEDCTKKEVLVAWNQVGPQGSPGIDGTDGTDGIDGIAGVDGESCSVAEDPIGTFTMTCPDSSEVTWSGVVHGPIEMTTSGNSWLSQGQFAYGYPANVTRVDRWATETTFFVPVRAVISLTGPGAVDGVDYGLESFDLCVITGNNYVLSVSVTGIAKFDSTVDDNQYLSLFRETFAFPPGLTTGCHTFEVNAPVGQGAGLMVEIADIGDGSPVTLSSVRSVWTP